MKGLTLYQPWASLMAAGAKRIETRSWSTSERGWVAIHAAKVIPDWLGDWAWDEPVRQALNRAGIRSGFRDLPAGAIVALARLAACISTPVAGERKRYFAGAEIRALPPDGDEALFGDEAPGRYAWVFTTVHALPEPVPWRGMQGLWPVPEDLERRLFAGIGHLPPAGPAIT
jgi:hypothetical protein